MNNKTRSTAILVIHGIGEQCPFQTLDGFVPTFWDTLNEVSGRNTYHAENRLRARKGWTQNYISIVNTDHSTRFDVYEYYWAHKPQRYVTYQDILEWLVKASEGAGKFYADLFHDQPEKFQEYREAAPDIFKNNAMVKNSYLRYLGFSMKFLAYFPWSWFFKWLKRIPVLSVFLCITPLYIRKAFSYIVNALEKKIIDYLGDVVIYTTTDMKSKLFKVRTEILYDAVEQIKLLMLNDDPVYDRIIIAGHSLGSVIAYDALTRVNHALYLKTVDPAFGQKITGLVTFGSPLDKVAFFYAEQSEEKEEVRRQILANYYSFKSRIRQISVPAHKMEKMFQDQLAHVIWLNFWNRSDKISGILDFYAVDKNIPLASGGSLAEAHGRYWTSSEMHRTLIGTLCRENPDE